MFNVTTYEDSLAHIADFWGWYTLCGKPILGNILDRPQPASYYLDVPDLVLHDCGRCAEKLELYKEVRT